MIVALLVASVLISHPYGIASIGGGVVICAVGARMAYLNRKKPDA